jgi:hypothetical protein
MGRKGKEAPPKPAVVPIAQPAIVKSNVVLEHPYIAKLRSLKKIAESDASERSNILESLSGEFKSVSCDNVLNLKKEAVLKQKIEEATAENNRLAEAAQKAKADYESANTSYVKLASLAQTLSDNIKKADISTSNAILSEQDKRSAITTNFSKRIAAISARLDSLTERRTVVMTENAKLKATLKDYLEEYDADQALQKQEEEERLAAIVVPESSEESNHTTEEAGTEELEPAANSTPAEEGTAATESILSVAAAEDGSQEEATETDKNSDKKTEKEGDSAVEFQAQAGEACEEAAGEEDKEEEEEEEEEEDDRTKLIKLQEREQQLRLCTMKYAEAFDALQTRLTRCSGDFSTKQASIESMSKEIHKLEKENAATVQVVSERVLSTKVIMGMRENAVAERVKQEKAMEKFAALSAILEKEIAGNSSR